MIAHEKVICDNTWKEDGDDIYYLTLKTSDIPGVEDNLSGNIGMVCELIKETHEYLVFKNKNDEKIIVKQERFELVD